MRDVYDFFPWEKEKGDGRMLPCHVVRTQGGLGYPVVNRSNGRQPIFRKEADYAAFEHVLEKALKREPLRIL